MIETVAPTAFWKCLFLGHPPVGMITKTLSCLRSWSRLLPQEAISSTIKLNDEGLVLGLLEFLQNDKKIKVCKNMPLTSNNDAIVFHDLWTCLWLPVLHQSQFGFPWKWCSFLFSTVCAFWPYHCHLWSFYWRGVTWNSAIITTFEDVDGHCWEERRRSLLRNDRATI